MVFDVWHPQPAVMAVPGVSFTLRAWHRGNPKVSISTLTTRADRVARPTNLDDEAADVREHS